VPAIVQVPSILAAARSAIEILLQFKGIDVVLYPVKGIPISKPGGGHDFADPTPRNSQKFAISKRDAFDGIEFSSNDEGMSRKRAYVMTGRYNAQIAIGDTFSDSEADYTVDTIDQTSGFKTQATATGFLKV